MTKLISVTEIAGLARARKPAFSVFWRPALMAYQAQYTAACRMTPDVDPCMLAAIVAQESGGRNILQSGIPPGPGCGVGICQITSGVDWTNVLEPSYPEYGLLLDTAINLRVCAEVFLQPLVAMFSTSHLAAFAAYNAGPGTVAEEILRGESPDTWTTEGDYGASVFTAWINFNAASLGVAVDWATFIQGV